jgi:hypothetical protein
MKKSPSLTSKEIADVKAALKEKRGRVFKTPEGAIADLHKFANSKGLAGNWALHTN